MNTEKRKGPVIPMSSNMYRRINQASGALRPHNLNSAETQAVLAQIYTIFSPNYLPFCKKMEIKPEDFRSTVRNVYKDDRLREIGREVAKEIREKENKII